MKNIFLSSTFRDMHAERDLVQERVLPMLNAEARKYGESVDIIDLRWGVDTSELESDEGSAKVLSVCMDEIDTCRPYMIIFIGERYGWIPNEQIIENAVKKRDFYMLLEDYEKSVTELEIEYGIFSQNSISTENAIICFRTPISETLPPKALALLSEDNALAFEKLKKLKERLIQKFSKNIIEYEGTWDDSEHKLINLRVHCSQKKLEDELLERLIMIFQKDWFALSNLSWFEKDKLLTKAKKETLLNSFVENESSIRKYCKILQDDKNNIFLYGESGSGKTSILFYALEQLLKNGKNCLVLLCDEEEHCRNYKGILRNICYYLETILNIITHKDTRYLIEDELEEYLNDLTEQLPSNQPLFIFIDALDTIFDFEKIKLLSGINNNLIYFITMSNPIPINTNPSSKRRKAKTFLGTSQYVSIEVSPLHKIELEELIQKKMAKLHKNTYSTIQNAIMHKLNVIYPLYVELIIERLKFIDGDMLSEAVTEDDILQLCVAVCESIPDDIVLASQTIMYDLVERIHPSLHVVLEYLSMSENGLRAEDLYRIFENSEKFSIIEIRHLINILNSFLYTNGTGFLHFKHNIFKKAILTNTSSAYTSILRQKEISQRIGDYIKTLKKDDYLRQHQGIYYAWELKDLDFLHQLILENEPFTDITFIQGCKKFVEKFGTKFLFDYLEKYLRAMPNNVQNIICNFLYQLLKEERDATYKIIALHFLNYYEDIKHQDLFKLFCLSKVADTFSAPCGKQRYMVINKYKNQLLRNIKPTTNLSQYDEVAHFINNWKKQNPYYLLPKILFKFFSGCGENFFDNSKHSNNKNSKIIKYRNSISIKNNLNWVFNGRKQRNTGRELNLELAEFFRKREDTLLMNEYQKLSNTSISRRSHVTQKATTAPTLYQKYLEVAKRSIKQIETEISMEEFDWAIDRALSCAQKQFSTNNDYLVKDIVPLYNHMADTLFEKNIYLENAITYIQLAIDIIKTAYEQGTQKALDNMNLFSIPVNNRAMQDEVKYDSIDNDEDDDYYFDEDLFMTETSNAKLIDISQMYMKLVLTKSDILYKQKEYTLCPKLHLEIITIGKYVIEMGGSSLCNSKILSYCITSINKVSYHLQTAGNESAAKKLSELQKTLPASYELYNIETRKSTINSLNIIFQLVAENI